MKLEMYGPVALNQIEKDWIEQANKMSKEIGVKITTYQLGWEWFYSKICLKVNKEFNK